MKKTTLSFFILSVFIILFAGGCKKTFDINHDPDNPTLDVGTAQLVFPVGVMGIAVPIGGELAITGAIFGEYLTQAANTSQYKAISQYDIKATDNDRFYRTLYTSGLKNLQYVIDKSKENNDWNHFLMATVMKAYGVSVLVDLFDQVPYSQALQGAANIAPSFDDGYTVYQSLLGSIDSALNQPLVTGKTDNSDIIFGGDITKWQAFANTLELKLYLRMVNAKPQDAQAGITSLYSRNASFLNIDAAVTSFQDVASKSNPMYEQNIRQLNTGNNLVASTTYASFLKSNSDPRIVYFFGSASAGSLDQGDYLNTSPTALAAAVFKQKPTDPVVFISKAESYFLQAEARVRYFGGDQAKDLYDQGVLAAFASVGYDGSSFIAPGGKYHYPAGTPEQNIEAIIVQKWASFPYGDHFIEGWFEKNRTGYPRTSPVYSSNAGYVPGQFVVAKNSVLLAGEMPERFVFPDVERSTNPNTPAEKPITTPVWWAKQ